MKGNIIIAGGGIGGLASAALLADRGFKVTLLEKNDMVGGRARYWSSGGFRFDMGPSWYLMPEVFENFFALLGKKREDYFSLKRLDPAYRAYFGLDDALDVPGNPALMEGFFDTLEPQGGKKLRRYLDRAQYKYDVAMKEFLYRDYSSIFDFLNTRMLVEGSRLNVFGSLDRIVSRHFSDRRSRQLLEYAMVFLGTSPKKAPGLYSIMSHVDLNLGVFYPSGGLAGVAASIAALAAEKGVEIITGESVEKVIVKNGRARGVVTGSGPREADAVLVNADYAHAEMNFLDDEHRTFSDKYWQKRVWAPSMFIMYLGLNKKLPSLQHHNLYFARDWDRHFDTIFSNPGWPDDPCFYVSCISKTDNDAAPAGGENVFVLVPVAPGLDDSPLQREAYADRIIEHIERVTGESISDSLAVRRIYSHRDFISDYNAWGGTALGLSHTLGQTAVFRPSMRSRKVNGLYYTGQYTHPGVGVPMVLIAAQVAADGMEKDFNRAGGRK